MNGYEWVHVFQTIFCHDLFSNARWFLSVFSPPAVGSVETKDSTCERKPLRLMRAVTN